MTNRGRKELNTIDGKESITKTNEHSDNNVQNYYHDLGEAIVFIVADQKRRAVAGKRHRRS
jgi:hypothetical protein